MPKPSPHPEDVLLPVVFSTGSTEVSHKKEYRVACAAFSVGVLVGILVLAISGAGAGGRVLRSVSAHHRRLDEKSWREEANGLLLKSKCIENQVSSILRNNSELNVAVMQAEFNTMTDFQNLVRTRQHGVDCKKAGLIVQEQTKNPLDGFALEFQVFGRLLMAAMASDRTLVVSNEWSSAYEPPNCDWDVSSGGDHLKTLSSGASSARGWNCIFEPLSWCTDIDDNTEAKYRQDVRAAPTPMGLPEEHGHGIAHDDEGSHLRESDLFDLHFHGVTRVIAAWDWTGYEEEHHLKWFKGEGQIDVVSGWERSHGRFWIRSQMAHALWRPSKGLAREIKRRMPPTLGNLPYIGFHIRYSDNIIDFKMGFGRNATKTRDFARYMAHADTYRKEHKALDLKTIFLATDSTKMLEASKDPKWAKRGWSFITQQDVQRSTGVGRIWFAAGRKFGAAAIAADLECLRRADFLVGSFQSNVYRLATELNMAWQMGKYPISLQRHRTVDVEYFEDP